MATSVDVGYDGTVYIEAGDDASGKTLSGKTLAGRHGAVIIVGNTLKPFLTE